MKKARNYSYRDVDMLMASQTIAESFLAHLSELSAVRSDWTEMYANGLIARIGQAIENYLGVDAKKELRSATSGLSAIQTAAKRDLSFFKVQVNDDFKSDPAQRDEILNTLGFTKHLREVQKGNQEELVQLLHAFKSNMTGSLRSQLTAKGMTDVLISQITGYAETFTAANVSQETLKVSTREITGEVADVFNAIYNEIIGICKKASAYYQYDAVKKDQFTFRRVVGNLGTARKTVPVAEP